ncbi:MAG: toll/interleukin-1 receptor domain-containing protein [Burkholderiales bacterium]
MSFEQHAFISYAHIDNEPLTPEQKGWVTQFHATLQTMLSQRLGEKARIWRDAKISGDDIFGAEIVGQLANTALLISILSPRYLRSEWCTRELREFCDTAAQHGGLTIGNKSRVVKVVKTPVEAIDMLPPIVQLTLGHEFYAVDSGEPIELDPAFGDRARQLFLSKLSGLAWEVAKSLQALMQAQSAAPEPAGPPKAVVFLADCGRDLREAREQIAIDLRMHGHEVLPAQQLPQTEDALVPELQAQLARAALAIHLVGRSAGPIPDGPSERSLVMLQNELAAELSQQGALRRIIWLPQGVQGERPEQQAFIDALQHDAALQAGADLLSGDLEALKGAIHGALRRLAEPPPPPPPPAGQPVAHLLLSEADRTGAVPLIKLLRARGLTVTIPVFVGDAAALREANTRLVAGCDALILFYGSGDEVWKFHQESELRKLAATNRDGRRSEWLGLAAPSTPDKELLQALAEPGLIDGLVGFSDAALLPLLAALDPARPVQ